jgi:uncharacterized membrane protein (DUF106 family)
MEPITLTAIISIAVYATASSLLWDHATNKISGAIATNIMNTPLVTVTVSHVIIAAIAWYFLKQRKT